MPFHEYFPTLVYSAELQRSGEREFNRSLKRECARLRLDDPAGRRWSDKHYPGGYTSYASAHRLQRVSPTFQLLERKLERHVKAFAEAAQWDLDGRSLSMTDCWVNIMPQRTVHSLHLHPLSTLSGTYYVQVPRGSPGLKFEDPRLDRFMAAPPRKPGALAANRPWVTERAEAGRVILFESWLRHEVVPNPARAERVSISFNYNWF
ncbi:MAG TPA: TIGR02466 family protein [Steroidobacteraceae bacterium]|nr:TIGR02466 family protein [Steroidobacteraceae bacterium]